MSHPPEPLTPIPWSVVAKRGESVRVPPPQSRFTSDGSTTSLSFVSIYEDEDLSNKLVADKAPRILQEALHPSAVLFTFLQSDFAKQSDLFDLSKDKTVI
ncbi:hypothetical protein BDB01DRAFT_845474 [Pilobolus umbonatus]|nr:hypothetical protein BDB01DRAFT_845474 [Pilobolus umbonatus]